LSKTTSGDGEVVGSGGVEGGVAFGVVAPGEAEACKKVLGGTLVTVEGSDSSLSMFDILSVKTISIPTLETFFLENRRIFRGRVRNPYPKKK
jgi:hypothetical protein